MPSDVLRVRNMCFYAHHGLFPEEGKLGQRFEVDVEIPGDFGGLSEREDLERTVDYPQVVALTESVVTGERFKLVEALADRIADVLASQLGLTQVLVRVRKPNPPVAAQFDGIEVEVRRGF
jgi:dihydroneopterin aldolase